MPIKREPCRNFQRGSCRYGDRCKFLHVTQQQPKSNVFGTQNSLPQQQKTSPFGFGSQSNQQPNSFGFGTHTSSQQQSNPFAFGAQSGSQLQQKPNPFGFGSQTSSQEQKNPNPFGFGAPSGSQQQKSNPFGFGSQSSSQQQQQQQNTNPFGFGVQGGSQSKQNQFKPFENKWTRSTSGGATQQSENSSQAGNHKCTDPEACKRQVAEDFEHEKPLWKLTCYGHSKNVPCDIVGDISYEELRAAAYDDAKRGMSLQAIVERERNLLNSKIAEFDNLLRKPYRNPNSSVSIQNPMIGTHDANALFGNAQNPNHPTISTFGQLNAPPNTNIGISQSTAPNFTPALQSSFQNQGPYGSQSSNQTPIPSFTSNFGGSGSMPMPNADSNHFSAAGIAGSVTSPITNLSAFTATDLGASAVANMTYNVQTVQSSETSTIDASIWLKENWTPGEIPEEAPPDIYVK